MRISGGIRLSQNLSPFSNDDILFSACNIAMNRSIGYCTILWDLYCTKAFVLCASLLCGMSTKMDIKVTSSCNMH